MAYFMLLSTFLLVQQTFCLIALLHNTNEETDVDSVATHVLFLEQKFSDFETDRTAMKIKTDALEADINAMKLEITKLKSENSKLEQELAFVKTSLNSVNGSLGCSGPEVSFEVVEITGAKRSLGTDNILILNNVTHNAGGGYHSSSGMFRAPEGGTYLFWAHIMEAEGKSLQIDLMKEGVLVARGFTPGGASYGTSSITTIVDVKRNDDLWLKLEYQGSINGWSQSSYGGILLCKQ